MRAASLLLAALALAGAGAPAVAQEQAPPPDEDAMCAVWASVVLGTLTDDTEGRRLFTYAIYHFIGRYEGRTGLEFGGPMREAAEYLDANPTEFDGLNARCGPIMDGLVARLKAWSAPEPQDSAGTPSR